MLYSVIDLLEQTKPMQKSLLEFNSYHAMRKTGNFYVYFIENAHAILFYYCCEAFVANAAIYAG